MLTSVDNAEDKWLHEQLKGYDKSVKVRPFDDATVYFVKKAIPLKRVRNFECEIVFRDLDRLLTLVTRPGFSRIASSIMVRGSYWTRRRLSRIASPGPGVWQRRRRLGVSCTRSKL